MEKNQHNQTPQALPEEKNPAFAGSQPGQQPPLNNPGEKEHSTTADVAKERHSESSFPQEEGETLGTP